MNAGADGSSVDATLRLVRAVGDPDAPAGPSLRLARRIMSSSLGGGGGLGAAAAGGGGANDDHSQSSSSSFAPAVVRNMCRSYAAHRRRSGGGDGAGRELSADLYRIERLCDKLRRVTEAKCGGNGALAVDIALLLTRLVGTGEDQQIRARRRPNRGGAGAASNASSSDAAMTDLPQDGGGDAGRRRRPDEDPGSSLRSQTPTAAGPNGPPHDVADEEDRRDLLERRRMSHYLRTVRHEEICILRECVYSLQGIDGSRIKFLLSEDDGGGRDRDDYYDYGVDDGHHVPASREGVRVYPNLSPSSVFEPHPEIFLRAGEDEAEKKKTDGVTDAANATTSSSALPFICRGEVSPAVLDAIKLCGECGWLFLKLRDYIASQQGKTRATAVPTGPASRALASALSEELVEYHRLVAILESQLLGENSAGDEADITTPLPLTLRRLVVWVRPAMHRLRTLLLMIDGVHPLRGGELASAVHRHATHVALGHPRGIGSGGGDGGGGDADVMRRLASRTAAPMYERVFHWVFGGRLPPPGGDGEFFVTEDPRVRDERMWQRVGGRYDMRMDMVPCFIPGRLAVAILDAGKGVNFVKKCLVGRDGSPDNGTASWDALTLLLHELAEEDPSSSLPSTKSPSFSDLGHRLGFAYGETRALEDTVARVGALAQSRIVSDMLHRYHLLDHLLALKRIVLLSQGDFLQSLLDGLGPVLSSPGIDRERGGTSSHRRRPAFDGGAVHKHTLVSVVDGALQSSNARHFSEDVLARVRVRMADHHRPYEDDDHRADKWESFSLDYAADDPPLAAVVHPVAQAQYRRVFHLLWKIKRLEWRLNQTWRVSTAVHHAVTSMRAADHGGPHDHSTASSVSSGGSFGGGEDAAALRRAAMTRQEVIHLTSNLQSYLMFEVVEKSWEVLGRRIGSARTLDDIIDVHDRYLHDIVAKSMLAPSPTADGEAHQSAAFAAAQSLASQLSLVLDAAGRFVDAQEEMFAGAMEEVTRAERMRRVAERRTEAGRWGYVGDDGGGDALLSDGDWLARTPGKLEAVHESAAEFDAALRRFLKLLNERIDIGGGSDGHGGRVETPLTDMSSASGGTNTHSMRRHYNNDDALRFLTFRLDFNQYYNIVR